MPRSAPSQPDSRPQPPVAPPAIGRRDRLIALLLFALCAVAYHRAPAHQVYDWRFSTAVSHALLHEGRLSVPRELLERSKYELQEVDGRVYHLYPAAPSLLNVPLVAVAEWLGESVYDDDGRFDLGVERRVLRAGAALVTAASVALLFLLGRLFLGRGWSLTLSLVFAFGTSLYSTASRPYWSHAWAVFFLALGMLCLLRPASRRLWARDAAGATALSWAFFCRPPLAISVLALTLFVTAVRRRRLLPLAVVGGGWAALFVGYSYLVFGRALPPYFGAPQAPSGHLRLAGLLEWHGEAALGTLFSPARGLFFFTPILLVILLALGWYGRGLDRRQQGLAAAGLAAILVHWHMVSSFGFWGGGASYGPRLFTDLLPWFFLLGALAMSAMRSRSAAGARAATRVWAVAALLMTLASLFIHYRGAQDRLAVRHAGFWNWRYPPFVFGLIPYPGTPVPGAELVYSANFDRSPGDGWANAARTFGFDLAMAPGIGFRRLEAAGGSRRGAFIFAGTGGGTTRPLQDLGGEPNATAGDATFEIWFRPATGGDRRQVLFETGGRRSGITIFVEAGRPGVGVRNGAAGIQQELISARAVARGRLSQLVVLLRATTDGLELTLYIDGIRAGGPRLVQGIVDWAGGGPSGLGTATNGPSLSAGEFHGELSLMRFYSAGLSEKQLRRNLRARTGPLEGSGGSRRRPGRLP